MQSKPKTNSQSSKASYKPPVSSSKSQASKASNSKPVARAGKSKGATEAKASHNFSVSKLDQARLSAPEAPAAEKQSDQLVKGFSDSFKVQKGGSLWSSAKDQLQGQGTARPTPREIQQEVNALKKVNSLRNDRLKGEQELKTSRSAEQMQQEQELFQKMARRVTPGSQVEADSAVRANATQDLASKIFKPEVEAGRTGSGVGDRFNKYMEESGQSPRMKGEIHGKNGSLFDMDLINAEAGLRQRVGGGFSR